jgi:hypothetical protein
MMRCVHLGAHGGTFCEHALHSDAAVNDQKHLQVGSVVYHILNLTRRARETINELHAWSSRSQDLCESASLVNLI